MKSSNLSVRRFEFIVFYIEFLNIGNHILNGYEILETVRRFVLYLTFFIKPFSKYYIKAKICVGTKLTSLCVAGEYKRQGAAGLE